MSDQDLEREIMRVAGHSALSVIRAALNRCRCNRYTLRSRQEQLFGDLVDAWVDLQASMRRARSILGHRCSSSDRHELTRGLRYASEISRSAVALLTSCIPVQRTARIEERAGLFLDHLFQHRDTRAMMQKLEIELERVSLSLSFEDRPLPTWTGTQGGMEIEIVHMNESECDQIRGPYGMSPTQTEHENYAYTSGETQSWWRPVVVLTSPGYEQEIEWPRVVSAQPRSQDYRPWRRRSIEY